MADEPVKMQWVLVDMLEFGIFVGNFVEISRNGHPWETGSIIDNSVDNI